MDFIDMLNVVARRWRVVVPVLIVGGLLTVIVAASIPDEYTVTGSIIVVEANESARVSAPILAEAMQDERAKAAVLKAGGQAAYRVEADGEDILRVMSEGDSEAMAVATVKAVLDRLDPVLKERLAQTGVRANLGIEILNRPATAVQVSEVPSMFEAVGSARLVGAVEAPFGPNSTARLLRQLLEDTSVMSAVTKGEGTTYQLETPDDLPIVTVTATGTDEVAVRATAQAVIDTAQVRLHEVLTGVGQDSGGVAVRVLVPPKRAIVAAQGLLRSVVALLAVTAGVAVAAALAWEGLNHVGRRNRVGAYPPPPANRIPVRRRRPGVEDDDNVPPASSDGAADTAMRWIVPGASTYGGHGSSTDKDRSGEVTAGVPDRRR